MDDEGVFGREHSKRPETRSRFGFGVEKIVVVLSKFGKSFREFVIDRLSHSPEAFVRVINRFRSARKVGADRSVPRKNQERSKLRATSVDIE